MRDAEKQEAVSLAQFYAFDNSPVYMGTRTRFLCMFCGHGKPADDSHRSMSVNEAEGVFICHRCNAKGRFDTGGKYTLDKERMEEMRQRKEEENRRKKDMMVEALDGQQNLRMTPGQQYLETRRISLGLALDANVKYSKDFMGHPAVMFNLKDEIGRVVAVQGRYIDGFDTPKVRTVGWPKSGAFWGPRAMKIKRGERICVTEAPIDALSLEAMGRAATSTVGTGLPMAVVAKARKLDLLFTIATDRDERGRECAFEWAEQLAKMGIRHARLTPPSTCKDWNDVIITYPDRVLKV